MSRAGWTPDFRAGVAELETEALLTHFHRVYRTSTAVSGVLRLLARPEDVRRPAGAWAALALEAANAAFVWRRTRQWRTMRRPGLMAVDTAVGVVAVTLGARSMSRRSQVNGTSWTNRAFDVRLAAVPLFTTDPRLRVVSIVAQSLPHALGRRLGEVGNLVWVVAPATCLAALPTVVVANRARHHARVLDDHAARWVDGRIDALLATERQGFVDDVLVGARATLAAIGDGAGPDLAATEEARVRSWLATDVARSDDRPAFDTSAQVDRAQRAVRRLSRRLHATLRMGTSVFALVNLATRPTVDGRTRAAAAAAVAAQGVVGWIVFADGPFRRLGPERAVRLTTAVDLVGIAATGLHQLREPHRSVGAWVESYATHVAATAGTVSWDRPLARPTVTLVGSLRMAVALSERRPLRRRWAAAANEQLLVQANAYIIERLFRTALHQARRLTEVSAELAATRRRDRLRHARAEQRAFVHNGVAQVLTAVAGGTTEPAQLAAWLDAELARLDAAIAGATPTPRSIEDGARDLRDGFDARGVTVDLTDRPLPPWTDAVAVPVTLILEEALNNVARHAAHPSAELAWEAGPASATITVTDAGPPSTAKLRCPGVGTSTMMAVATTIGARLTWEPAPAGGTEVRLVVPRPTTHLNDVT